MTTANPKPNTSFELATSAARWVYSALVPGLPQASDLLRPEPLGPAPVASEDSGGLLEDPTEEEVIQAAELESLGMLAGGIAHDFNNLLTGILGNAHLALGDLQPGQAREAVLEVETAARRAKELVAQILAWSGRGRLELRPTELGALVTETRQLLARVVAPSAEIVLEIEPGATVEADPAQLRQVVMNLLTNASDALGGRPGRIDVRVKARCRLERAELDATLLGSELAPGTYVLLEVRDGGCGMSPRTVARIFEPFFTTKPTGRGLGLAALRGIVRNHHGAVAIESAVGRGTVFRVWLPRSDSDSLTTPGPAFERSVTPPRPTERPMTVLVVEDEDLVRRVTARMVGRLGYEVITTTCGPEALEVLGQANQVDFCLVDVQMPGMTGREVLQQIRKDHPGLPVVLMTGYAGPDSEPGQAVPDAWLRKPFSIAELQQVTESAGTLARRQAPGQP